MKTIIFLVLFNVFGLSLGQTGPNGQDCSPDEDTPEVCTAIAYPWDDVTVNGGKVECETNFDCCLCKSIVCNNCEAFVANGDSSAFYVFPIEINGDADDLAEIECTGDSSCEGAQIAGTYIKGVKCGGDRSCLKSTINIQCTEDDSCKFECDGDQACEEATIYATNVDTMACGGDRACFGAGIGITCNADEPCKIECDGDNACAGANIIAHNVEILSCKGKGGCEGATINIYDPAKEFKLECGDAGCRDIDLNIYITNDITEIKEISCGAEFGCQNAHITFINTNGKIVEIEKWNCEGKFACNDAVFELGANVVVEECECGEDYDCWNVQMSQADCLIDETIEEVGFYGQTCVWYPEDDGPDVCKATATPWDSVDKSKIECDEASDCCLCKSITCTNCDEFKATGDFAAYKVGDITISGTASDPTQIDCGGYSSCEGTTLNGFDIKEADCGGYRSCYDVDWNLECSQVDLCSIDCEEELSCAQSTINAGPVKEFKCGGKKSCYNSNIHVVCDEDEPCEIECEDAEACLNAHIYAEHVGGFKCGDNGCNDAYIKITDPDEDFELECGDAGCKGLSLVIVVTNSVTKLKQISCASENGCEDAVIVIENYNQNGNTLTIEKLDCEEEDACKNMELILVGSYPIEFDDCLCGDVGDEDYGCEGATIDIHDPAAAPAGGVDCFPISVPAKSEHKGNVLTEISDNTNESENVILNVTLSKMTWINVWGIFGVIIVANVILYWCCCIRNKSSTTVSFSDQ